VLRHRSEDLVLGGWGFGGTGAVAHQAANGRSVLTGAVSIGRCGRR
jgi:hypothetical protein